MAYNAVCEAETYHERRIRRNLSWSFMCVGFVLAIVCGWVLTDQRSRREQAEEAARMAGLRAELIVVSSPAALIMCSENGTIALCNPAAAQMFGWQDRELIGRDVSVLLPESIRAQHKASLAKAVADLSKIDEDWLVQRTNLPTTALCKDGGTIPIYLSIRMIKYGGKIEFVASMRPQVTTPERSSQPLPELPLQMIQRN